MNKRIIFAVIILIIGIFALAFLTSDNVEEKFNKIGEVITGEKMVYEEPNVYVDYDPLAANEELVYNPDVIVLDVSSAFEGGHLPDAINYYVGDGSLDEAIPNLDKSKGYLVYCHVESASRLGAQKLIDAGFKKVYRLAGEYSGWVQEGYPVEINLHAVGDYSGSGKASRSYSDKVDQFRHSVVAELDDPVDGKFYEGWLVTTASPIKFVSTGKLNKEDGQYMLNYKTLENIRNYNQVVITEETEANGQDNIPETHVLEGIFK